MNEKMTHEQLKNWREFWATDTGKLALEKMQKLKEQNLEFAMDIPSNYTLPDQAALAYLNRARGISIVIDDIKAGIAAAEASLEKGENSSRD